MPVFFLPNETLRPVAVDLVFAIIYIEKNIIGALVVFREALVIINSTTVPTGRYIADPELAISEVPLPSFNAEICPGANTDPVDGPKDPDANTWNLLYDPVMDCP